MVRLKEIAQKLDTDDACVLLDQVPDDTAKDAHYRFVYALDVAIPPSGPSTVELQQK